MRNVLVRIYDANGRPVQGARVVVHVYQFMASGTRPDEYTDSSGEVEIDLDIDDSAEISISVNGTEAVRRSTPKGQYRLTV